MSSAKLPVESYKEQILVAIEQHNVVVISGETGSGKTTKIPQFILDANIANGSSRAPCIYVTQPRRIAAVSIATRVSAERKIPLGHTVGYQIRNESKTSPETKLTFVTR